ncbi:MAG: DsbA family protein [Gammaproteobacteria bacterium]|nr:DsbA family protein [Gammaproteobacteria bacterium]
MQKNIVKFILLLLSSLFPFMIQAQPINELFHETNDPFIGNPKGNITIVEFFDYQCSHCMNMAPVIEAIKNANPDVRIVFKDFPIRGPISEFSARAALAAKNQHKYYELSHALLNSHQRLTREAVLVIASSVGLDIDKLKKDMNSHDIAQQLNANIRLANKLNLNGTPAFYFGKTQDGSHLYYTLGEMTQQEMQDAINKTKE